MATPSHARAALHEEARPGTNPPPLRLQVCNSPSMRPPTGRAKGPAGSRRLVRILVAGEQQGTRRLPELAAARHPHAAAEFRPPRSEGRGEQPARVHPPPPLRGSAHRMSRHAEPPRRSPRDPANQQEYARSTDDQAGDESNRRPSPPETHPRIDRSRGQRDAARQGHDGDHQPAHVLSIDTRRRD